MSEVDLEAGLLGEGFVSGHFPSLVVGERAAHLCVEAVEDVGEGVGAGFGASVLELDQGDEEGGSFDQGSNPGLIEAAFDQVSFPVSWHQTEVGFFGALIDECDGVGEGALMFGEGAALFAPSAQQGEDTAAQLSLGHGVEGGVDGFVAELDRFWHTSQCARDLFGTQAAAKVLEDDLPQGAAGNQLARGAGLAAQPAGRLFGRILAGRGSGISAAIVFIAFEGGIPMARLLRLALLLALLPTVPWHSPAQDRAKFQPPIWSAKPDIAAWEKIENDRLNAAKHSIDQLLAVKGRRTIENTLVPYDDAVRQINAAIGFSVLMQQVHHDASFRDRATAMNTKANGALTALSLNRTVYNALAALDVSQAYPATRYYVRRQLLEFRLAGVDKDDATRKRLKELNDKLSEDVAMFDRNISDDIRTVEVASVSELDGLPQDYIDRHKPDADGKIRITTNYPDFYPVITFARNDDLRRKLWVAFLSRAYSKNRDVLLDMMRKRHEIASIIGYASWADYNAADKMIGSGHAIGEFLDQFNAAARPAEQREFAMMLKEKQKTEPGATEILPHQRAYLIEQVRRSQYDFDSQEVRPYLSYSRVKQGVLDTAAALFHVSFRQEQNAPAWDASVETWDVIEDGRMIGRFYLDMHPRPGKFSHGNEVTILDGVRGKQLPEDALVLNLPEPTATDPGLMDYDDAVTFFHEFGHLMHDILGGQGQWAGSAGTRVELDFLEAPSQMLERWMHSPQVLASFARHYKTGEPIPTELVTRMNRADAFGRAGLIATDSMISRISYDIYKDAPANVDLSSVVLRNARRYTLITPLATDETFYANFNHLALYSSAYYTYLWDKVIAADFFQQFDPKNPLAGDVPMRYRRQVLEPGASMSANDLVKNFLGRPQNTAALQKWLDQEFEGGSNAVN